jgi:hypothetical protein
VQTTIPLCQVKNSFTLMIVPLRALTLYTCEWRYFV